MISRACYVTCDYCDTIAEVTTLDAKDARAIARQAGFKRVGSKDICKRHIRWSGDRKTWWLADLEASPEVRAEGTES